ncbi:MAG: flagellar biosynthesis protein FlhA, partial [Dethiobacteria bacterium]|nr:flagellar biosynthesis protein FlhA [Dethiobacteria bacterium]
MAVSSRSDYSLNSLGRIIRGNTDMMAALGFIFMVTIIIIPISTWMLDILLTLNIALGLVILLVTLFSSDTRELNIFPSILLTATLFRLALNISSTRLILSQADAGDVVQAFGQFVVAGNYVVGLVVFIIITLVQFVVITNGAGRIAEVAARFTLDALPGKQMSIDADFNAGLIDEETARTKRKEMQKEADFYGSMDGASKFVRGDAIAGIVIVLVNILGGLGIGVMQMGMSFEDAASTFTTLTIGDGLVAQVPALLISTSAGMLVTRSTAEASFGEEIATQISAFPKVILLASVLLFFLGIVPGLPPLPFFLL